MIRLYSLSPIYLEPNDKFIPAGNSPLIYCLITEWDLVSTWTRPADDHGECHKNLEAYTQQAVYDDDDSALVTNNLCIFNRRRKKSKSSLLNRSP